MTFSQNKKYQKVTAVLLSYNYGKYLKWRLESIINQTYPINELIILDDCSNDSSVEIIKKRIQKIQTKHPKLNICFIKNKINSGKSILQWKKAFELATGDYIWLCEADDLANRKFLETTMSGFLKDKNVILSCTNSIAINSKGIPLSLNFNGHSNRYQKFHWQQDYINSGKEEIRHFLAVNCSIPNVSGVVFKNNKNIPFTKYLDEATRFNQVGDWYFYIKVLEHGKIAYSHRPLNYFRIHNKSVTAKSKKGITHFNEIKQIHNFISDHYQVTKETQNAIKKEQQRIANRYDIIE